MGVLHRNMTWIVSSVAIAPSHKASDRAIGKDNYVFLINISKRL